LPLHAQVFVLCCFLTKPAVSGFSMKTNILNDLKFLTRRYNALLSAFSVILAGVFISRDFGYY
jgi:hypothetical protein